MRGGNRPCVCCGEIKKDFLEEVHEPHGDRGLGVLCFLLYPQGLGDFLAHSRHVTNTVEGTSECSEMWAET